MRSIEQISKKRFGSFLGLGQVFLIVIKINQDH